MSLRVRMPARRQRLDCTRILSPRFIQLLVYAMTSGFSFPSPFLLPSCTMACTMACALQGGPRVEGMPLKCTGMATTSYFFTSYFLFGVDLFESWKRVNNALCHMVHECTPGQKTMEYVTMQQVSDNYLQRKNRLRNNRRPALNPGWDTRTSWSPAPMLGVSLANLVNNSWANRLSILLMALGMSLCRSTRLKRLS